jgi:3'(2'), 5'-bisphosphate nucleotidase
MIKKLIDIAIEAGNEIMRIYNLADFGVEMKADNSPLTLADKASNKVIMDGLKQFNYPILSEEGAEIPYSERKKWSKFWLIDPLDGTKEFIKKNGEFTVNIALIHNGEPVIGVVYAPVLDWMFWGNSEGGWKASGDEPPVKLAKKQSTKVKTIVASRSHLSAETQEIIDKYPGAEVISMGSSLKFLLLAENKAQLYPRFAPTMEWDTAAAHGVLRALGYVINKTDKPEPLTYNKENLLNPWFIAS